MRLFVPRSRPNKRLFSDGASENRRRCHSRTARQWKDSVPERRHHLCPHAQARKVEMTGQKLRTILGVALAFACVANPGLAQTQATTATGPSANQNQSDAALAQEATNPFSSAWLMQIQQNNNWMEMPSGDGDRMQSNLLFQPLMSVRLANQF
jgi:hypothetical protein